MSLVQSATATLREGPSISPPNIVAMVVLAAPIALGLKEKGALMLIPSSAVESMGMGGLMGAAALQQSQITGGAALKE